MLDLSQPLLLVVLAPVEEPAWVPAKTSNSMGATRVSTHTCMYECHVN